MLFSLEVLPAEEGDCLLLHWGTLAEPKLAVIDGGPGNVYARQLRPRLMAILNNRGLSHLSIDLAVVSHIDLDHIVGIKKLFGALKKEIEDVLPKARRSLSVKRLWHNTFNDILGDAPDEYYRTLSASVQASTNAKPSPAVVRELEAILAQRQSALGQETVMAYDIARVLAGHGEGRKLRDDYQYIFNRHETATLNSPYVRDNAPTLITSGSQPTSVTVRGLTLIILGPQRAEIDALQKAFDKYIRAHGLNAQAVLAACADPSINNLSSIVFIAKMDGKQILFAGDARGDKILESLRAFGYREEDDPIRFDVLKVPHHGSDNNVDADFFKRVVADTYVFSGNGKHGNPERSTLDWLMKARGQGEKYKIILTYSVAEIDKERKADRKIKNKAWNSAKDSLKTLFDAAAQNGYQFTLHEGAPMRIDLGNEKVTF
jgi:hypothetical protein